MSSYAIPAASRSADSIGDHLQLLLTRAVIDPAKVEEPLRSAVRALAREARAGVVAPAEGVLALKRAVTKVAVARRASYRAANALTDRVLAWYLDGLGTDEAAKA
jgi:hypothetical protein